MPPSDVTVSTSSSVSVSLQRGERRDVVLDAGGRLRVHDREQARAGLRALRVEQPLRVDRAAPRRVDAHDLRAAPARDLAHALAEHAVDADDHGVAGLDEVDEARLHARRAGAADRQRQRVRRCGTRRAAGRRSRRARRGSRDRGGRAPGAGTPPSPRDTGSTGRARAAVVRRGSCSDDATRSSGRGRRGCRPRRPASRRSPSAACTDTTTITPPTITSTRPGSSPGLCAPLRDRLGRERAEDLLGRGARQPEVVDALALATRRHRARSRPSSTPCPRCRSASSRCAAPGTARSTSARWSRTTDTATLSSSARRRVGVQELLGEPHAADVDRDAARRARRCRR